MLTAFFRLVNVPYHESVKIRAFLRELLEDFHVIEAPVSPGPLMILSVEKGLELCEEAQKVCETCAVHMTAWYFENLQVEIQIC